jgi:hypothetical protein
MNADKEYSIRIRVNSDRPDFRLFNFFLWGENHRFDSEGDSYNPASRTWTSLYMGSREHEGEYFEIAMDSEEPLIFRVTSPIFAIANRVALFLAIETRGSVIDQENKLLPYDSLENDLGGDFYLSEALERAQNSIWRRSTLENPYPNLNPG